MTQKELLYIEDGLNHIQLLKSKCSSISKTVEDQFLKNLLTDLNMENCNMYNKLFKLLEGAN